MACPRRRPESRRLIWLTGHPETPEPRTPVSALRLRPDGPRDHRQRLAGRNDGQQIRGAPPRQRRQQTRTNAYQWYVRLHLSVPLGSTTNISN